MIGQSKKYVKAPVSYYLLITS